MKETKKVISDESCSKTLSVWTDTFPVPEYAPLKENIAADVCIVGAGISGITCAYLLACEGLKVIVLDDGEIGGGETGNTTAHITSVIDDRYSLLEKMHGVEAARIAAQSQRDAVKEIEKIVLKENINCDFEKTDGYLLFESGDDLLTKEFEAAMRAGMEVSISDHPLDSFKEYSSLKFPGQAQFHVLKYVSSLAGAILKMNGRIYTNTNVTGVEDNETGVVINTKDGFCVTTGDAVIATNSPVSDYVSIHTKQTAYRTYVIGYRIKKNSVPAFLYWDTESPYHYVRVYKEKDADILIIGGEDHKTGQENNPEERFERLEKWAAEHFNIKDKPVYNWSGQVMEPVDGLSFIGKDPENKNHVYIITGDSGMGITHATYGGMNIRDLIIGKENKWAELYDPGRITYRSALEYIKEGANTLSQYIDLISAGDVNIDDEIQSGNGALIREGFDKIAVYKDENGEIFRFSALCPHLKCVLHWNQVEKSWDCPCHGSRFDCKGKLLNGPAISDMRRL
jgi:glycine/D-amino acid oxidase-like deaminating enzyme/nitrite reductase/ring-hydroxylating ferredoxin subunit